MQGKSLAGGCGTLVPERERRAHLCKLRLRALCEAKTNPPVHSVAIYHLSVKTISRSAGRSATAAAAYRAGDRIADERTGELHDYGRKGGVESAELILPADAPAWAADRAALWNAAEQAERRKNSTVAREFEIALPAELSSDERARLARDFTREIVEQHGCAADVCIHAPSRGGDQRNHHAHILLTTRRLGQDGLTEKTRELDDKLSGPALVTSWRERFAVLQNERLREAGLSVQVDHRSLDEQGIERVATRHLGPAATGFERRTGRASHRRRLEAPSQRQRRALAAQVERQKTALKSAEKEAQGLSGELQAAQQQRVAEREAAALAVRRRAKAEAEDRRLAAERAERERIEAMSSRELAAEIERIRPSDPGQLAEADPAVIEARKAAQRLAEQREEAEKAKAQAERQEAAWRLQHPYRSRWHDAGWWPSEALAEFAEARETAQERWQEVSPQLVRAKERLHDAQAVAQVRIKDDQRPARARVAELEAIRQEKARQERAESERLERSRQAQAGRDQVVQGFKSLAVKRAGRFHGFRDGGKQWEATPEPLRALVEGFNAMPKARQERVLQGLRRDPEKNAQVGGLLRERQQNIERGQDRGLSR